MLGIFGKLRDRTLDVISLIGRELMRESPLYEEIAEEGEQTGLRKANRQVQSVRFGDEAAGEFAEDSCGAPRLAASMLAEVIP